MDKQSIVKAKPSYSSSLSFLICLRNFVNRNVQEKLGIISETFSSGNSQLLKVWYNKNLGKSDLPKIIH